MVAEQGSAVPSGGKRRSQDIARAQRRRRRPNIDGPKHTVEVVLSEEEFAKVRRFADEANMTVPWYLVQAAVNPVAATGEGTPRLAWPKLQTLQAILMSATSALDAIRLEQLAKIGGHFNQIAHAANISGAVEEDLFETTAELREVLQDVRERAERIEELAREVTRR